ncbi:tripartite tricarboxylate transporter substrate binding protein [Candidimonas sp. SYP-B2681]|nr:tripartite tricarboxylate transporter substrate binding protein [Candidimonas sp. SYP-B2681]
MQKLLVKGALILSASVGMIAGANAVHAADYPQGAITFIVPYAAGGSSDTRSRQLAQKLSEYLGQTVVVDNRPGASGNIGTAAIARAKPDGYTIGLGNFAPLATNQALYEKLPFDPQKDVQPIALLEKGPLVLAVSAKSSYTTIAGLIAHGKQNPDNLNYGSTGAGGASNLVAELLKNTAGFEAAHIPYRGGAPAVNDLIAGNVDFVMDLASLFIPHATGANPRVRILAVTSAQRLSALPAVPTFTELGLPAMNASNWFGVIAPKGVPAAVIQRLNEGVNRAVQDAEYARIVDAQGAEVGGGTPDDFTQFVRSENARWTKLIKEKGMRAQ